MPTSESPSVLEVWIGETRAGTLTRTGEGASFRLDDDYLTLADRPVLGQVFEDDPRAEHHVRFGVPVWFANLLPEGALRELIARRADVHVSRSWFLLGLLGADLPGAVVIRAAEGAELLPEEIEQETDSDEQSLKFSLAGVQLKFSALREGRGLTVPVHGSGGDWIVKLPDQRYDGVPETEFATMNWAREAGLDVPPTDLVDVSEVKGLPTALYQAGGKALAVQRFDRRSEGRVHIEDFAQVFSLMPDEKYGHTNYESIARFLHALAPAGVDEMVRRLVFQILAGNGDAHAKNWSLIYPDGIQARLSPAYDLVNTTAYIQPDDLALNLGGTRDFEKLDRQRFRRFARHSGLDEGHVVEVVDEQVQITVDAWEKQRSELGMPDHVADEINRRLRELPLVTE